MSDIRLLGPIGDEDYDRLASLIELALTPDELEAFEQAPPVMIEATLGLLRMALGNRASIAHSTVRLICGLA